MTDEQIDTVEQDERGAQRKVIEPLKEPVSIKKALLGGMTAQVSSSQAVGQPASHAVFLVNIQLTGWSSDKVRAEGFADGFNKAAEWMQSAMSARAASTSANVAQGAEAVATVKVYETYTGQDGWIEVTQEEYDRTKDKYEHRIRRVPAPPVQTALTDDAREPHIPTKRLLHLADQAGIIPDKRAVAFYKAIKAEHAAQSASGDKS
jgi:hypothetical protein